MEITRLPRPTDPAGPGFAPFELDARLWDEVLVETAGDADLGQSALRRWAECDPNPHTSTHWFGASVDSRLVGVATLDLPQQDNRRIAYVSVAVERDSRGRGIGGALLEAALETARADGRKIVQAWTWETRRDPAEGGLSARDGDGVIDPASPRAGFLLAHGFRLAQVETMSRLMLPDRNRLLGMLGEAADAAGDDYELVSWVGATPPGHLDDVARLMETMSTDVPTGEAELEAEAFDAARVRLADARLDLAGATQIITAARHRRTGALVGFTRLIHDPARPEVGDQWDTLVVGPHRGHGLGLWMKCRNLIELGDARPAARRVVTGNASENAHMLAINTRLGFVPVATSGWFERRESTDGAQ